MEKENEEEGMMWWNYRRVRKTIPGTKDVSYFIVEAYYTDGKVDMITEKEMAPWGENEAELLDDFEAMAEAFGKPVLDYDTREEITDG